jgi:arylsulfatase A-like enzyme
MLTGRHPREHGAGMAGEGRDASSMTARLREDLPTLAEAFAAVGYQTVSLTTNPHLRAENGLARGFDTHRNLMIEEMTFATSFPLTKQAITATGWMQTQRARAWLALRDRDRPLFMLLHYMDPHLPRDPPEGLVAREIATGTPAGEAAVYGAMLRRLDDALGELFGALESAGRLENTLVVITSDHGEGLGPEPERRGHGNSLLPPVTRSLLIVRSSSFPEPGRICPETRSLVDLASTIAELAGLDSEIGTGQTLVDREGHCRPAPGIAFFGAISKGPLQDGLMTPDYGLIATKAEDGRARFETFDRRRDPGFRAPIEEASAESEALRASLLEHLAAQRAHTAGTTPPGPTEMSDAVREQLRALGYTE